MRIEGNQQQKSEKLTRYLRKILIKKIKKMKR